MLSADLSQIAERLKNPAKANKSLNTALVGGFFLNNYQIKIRHLNYIVRLTFRRSTKKGEKKWEIK